jgi:hypothetical protein
LNWEFLNVEIILPFLEFMDKMEFAGSDLNAHVTKLLKFRPEYTEEMKLKEEQFQKGKIAIREEDI